MILPFLWSMLTADIDSLLNDSALRGASVAVYVCDIEGHPVYERNINQLMTPGSNQKLLTNLFALHTLGADYVAQTRIWKFKDKLVIDAPGDPTMTRSILLRARMALGISASTAVEVHEAYAPGIPPSWEFDDLPNKYAAPITALSVDKGSFEIWAENEKILTIPKAIGVRVRTIDGPGKPVVTYDPFKGLVSVTGTLPKQKTRLDTLAIPKPDEASAWMIGGEMKLTSDIPTTPPDVVIASRSVGNIVAECLTMSDNNFAEHLLLMSTLKLGAMGGDPYSIAQKRISGFLGSTVGLEQGSYHVEDGSGISRHNMITAKSIVDLLLWANKQPFASVFKAALAVPGKGTLKNRLSGIEFHGKTGSLDLVSALSGYLKTPSGKELVISILFNQCTAPDATMHQIQDGILSSLLSIGTFHAFGQSYAEGSSLSSTRAAASHRLR